MAKIDEQTLKKTLFDEYQALQVAIQDIQLSIQAQQQAMQGLQSYLVGKDWWNELAQVLPDDNPQQANTAGFRNKGQQVANLAQQLIKSKNGGWATTPEIFEFVSTHGLSFSGNNPHATVSAHLSNSGLFVNERAKGWKMK